MDNLYNTQNYIWDKTYKDKLLHKKGIITEKDFYPPSDNRVLSSGIRNIYNGDNFEEYAEYIFELYESEDYYEN